MASVTHQAMMMTGSTGGVASTAFLARTSGLDATHTNAYIALIDGLVSDGIWTKLDALYMFATQDSATALLNLVSASYACTAVNSPTFTADQGFTGASSGTKYLSSNFNPSTAGGQWTQNSAHLSIWSLTASGFATPTIGGNIASNTNNAHIYAPDYNGDNQLYVRINSDNSGGGMSNPSPNTVGHYLGNRTASNSVNGFRNGSNSGINPSATTSVSIPNITLYIVANNNNGTAAAVDMQAAMASIGASLSADASNFYTRCRTYMTAVGVP